MFLRLAWRNIWRNKRRTMITLAAIGFAVLMAVIFTSYSEGSYQRMVDNMVGQSLGYVQIHKKGFWEEKTVDNTLAYSPEVAEQIKAEVADYPIVPRLESFALAAYHQRTRATMVMGVDPQLEDEITKLSSRLADGQMIEAGDEAALMAEGLAEYLGIGVGDTLVLIGQGYHGANAAGKFVVKGIIDLPSPELNKQLLYLPLGAAQYLYAAEDRVTSLTVHMSAKDPIMQVQEQLQQSLDTANTFEVMNWTELSPEMYQSIEMDRASRDIMFILLYVIIGFSIYGTFLMMTKERSYEFGVSIAIGMKRRQLMLTVLMEIVLMAILGALVGILVAMPITGYFTLNPIEMTGDMAAMYEQYGFEPIVVFAFVPEYFIQQGVIVVIMALILSISPLRIISRTKVIQAMRA